MPRRDDDWDDENERPRRRSRNAEAAALSWVAVGAIGLALLAVVAVGVALLALMAQRGDRTDRDEPPAPKPAARVKQVDNWPRFLGLWRDPGGSNELREFVVRPDRTATLTFVYPDDRKVVHETRVEVIAQGPDTIRVQFHVSNGMYSYPFRFEGDNRLKYDDPRRGAQVYERLKQ